MNPYETLRDRFAEIALKELLSRRADFIGDDFMIAPEVAAKRAYQFADAMMEARKP